MFKTLFARSSNFFWYASVGLLLLAAWMMLKGPYLVVFAVPLAVIAVFSMWVSFSFRKARVEISENGIAGHGLLRVPFIGWSEVSRVSTVRAMGLNYVLVGSYSGPGDFRLGPFTRADIEKITEIWESRPD
ncbi:hypothetical protein ABGB12_20895 [Actinocorallia sp. B10E7]|uniref:hypothetical protein n=1 Tax=Actinocorallia sp. B10E7 TaxID=3153558 RepID=UPI00325ECD37